MAASCPCDKGDGMGRVQGTIELAKVVKAAVMILLVGFAAVAKGQDSKAETPVERITVQRQVVVSIPDRKLAVLENGKVVRIFRVAVGRRSSPSPTGEFRIAKRLSNPTYYHPGVVIPPGDDNPLGPRWVGLDQKGYGIHGTNEPWSIGKAASHGCIRMRNGDIKQFFALVSVGDAVQIRAERDQQIAEIFGGETQTIVAQADASQLAGAGGSH